MSTEDCDRERLDHEIARLRSRLAQLEGQRSGVSRSLEDRPLRDDTAFHSAVIDSVAEGLCVCHESEESPYLAFTIWNTGMTAITGYTMGEINDLGWYQSMYPDPDLQARAVERMDQMRRGDNLVQEEWEVTRKDGAKRVVTMSTSVLESSDGLVHVLAVMQDVTGHKRAEQDLLDREATLSAVFRAAPVGIGVVVDRVCTQVNDRFCEMVGYEKNELLGHNARQVYPDDEEYERVGREKYHQIAEHGTGVVETRLLRKDGVVIDVLMSSTPLQPDDLSRGLIFTALDITLRKRAENALRQSEERYRDLVEMADIAILVDDAEGRILYANRKFTELFGYSEDEVLALSIGAVVHPDDVDTVMLMHRGRLAGHPVPTRYEFRGRRRDGETLHVEVDAVELTEDARAVGTRSYIRDISERKRLEKQLLQAQKLEGIGRLAGGVAHDFNNILQTMFANLDFAIGAECLTEPCRERLHGIQAAATRAASLTRQLLAFSRRQVIEPNEADLNELVGRHLKLLRRIIGEHIELEFVPGDKLDRVFVDAGQIEQVLMNLVVNARDAMPDGGTITIRTEGATLDSPFCDHNPWARPGEWVILRVEDTGIGMDEPTRRQIFEPFFTTKEPGQGTGLGLSTVYGIVRQHEGMIEVASAPGSGTEFAVYLPCVEPGRHIAAEEPRGPAPGGTETILVAEDETTVRELLVEALQAAGYTVVSAADGDQALDLYETHSETVSLALLDAVMPKRNGWEVWKQIRSKSQAVRVLFSSGYRADTLLDDVALIQKPYTVDDLLRAVRKVLDE